MVKKVTSNIRVQEIEKTIAILNFSVSMHYISTAKNEIIAFDRAQICNSCMVI